MNPELTWMVGVSEPAGSPDARGWMAPDIPDVRAVFDCLIWPWHLDALIPSVALECMTVERLTLALVVAAAAVPRSAARSPGTFVVGWRPPPFERRRKRL